MNKLLFTFKKEFGKDIVLVCNNPKDLHDYLKYNYNWFSFKILTSYVSIIEDEGGAESIASLKWIRHI